MYHFDASSFIYAWDNYPLAQFPGVWDWVESQLQTDNIGVCEVVVEEIKNKSPECMSWLHERGLSVVPVFESIIFESMKIKELLGILGDRHHSKGVGENDIFIIATAKVHNVPLATDEER